MGSIILPNQWARQPQYPAPLNLNGFCRDVGFVYLPNIGYVDLANKVTFSVITELTSRAGNNQIGGYPTSGTGYANTGPTNFSLGYTLFAVCSASGTATEAIMDDDLGGTRGFQFRFTNTGAINFIPFTNSDSFASVQSSNYTAAELAAGVPVVARVDASGNIAVFGKGGKFTGSLGVAPRIPGNVPGNTGIRFFRWKGGGNQLTKPLFMAGALNRVVSDVEAFAFLENPWKQVFAPQQRRIWVPSASVGGGSTDLNAESGSYSTTGSNATLAAARSINAGSGSYSITGVNAALTSAKNIVAASGSYSITGADAELSYASSGSLNAESGAYAITGNDVTFKRTYVTNLASGSYAVTGNNATLQKGYGLNAGSGVYSVTGAANAFIYNQVLNASPGSYLITGLDAVLVYSGSTGYELSADPSDYSITGFDVTFTFGGLWTDVPAATGVWTDVTPSSDVWTDH